MKKFICLLLSIIFCFSLSSCDHKKVSSIEESLILIDEVKDRYNNILSQTFYNKAADNYILREYTYDLRQKKWICIDQQTTIISSKSKDKSLKPTTDMSLKIYYNSDLANGPITIMDNEYAEIYIIKYLARDYWWEFGYELKIINKTNKVITVFIDDGYIMGIQCMPLFDITHINAGQTTYFTMAWDKETLERNHIPYIDNIEFMIRIYNNDNWKMPALEGAKVLIKK